MFFSFMSFVITENSFRLLALLFVVAGVSYVLGILTGSYCFPVYCPPEPLTQEEKKRIDDIRKILELHPNQPVDQLKDHSHDDLARLDWLVHCPCRTPSFNCKLFLSSLLFLPRHCMNPLFTHERYVPDPDTPGKGTYFKCNLLVSLFPYKRGTKIDEITIDVANGTVKIVRGHKTTSYGLIVQLNTKKV